MQIKKHKEEFQLAGFNRRWQIILSVRAGLITGCDAAEMLSITERHVWRLLQGFRKVRHLEGVMNGRVRANTWHRTDKQIEDIIVRLKRERISRSNQHIADLVEEETGKTVSRSTVRDVLIRNDCYEKTEREHRSFQKLEINSFGQMLQMDTCEGAWLAGYRRVNLIAVIDAYSRYVVGWRWVEHDGSWENIVVIREIIEKYGLFEMLYTDNASFFKVIRKNQSFYQEHKPDDQYETAIQRMLSECGILLVAHKPYRPQGKGRLERFFRFMEDRFIPEHTAKNLKELNQQFKKWLGWYNNKHVNRIIGCKPKDRLKPSCFKPAPEDLDLDLIFSYYYTRKIDKYNGFSFEGKHYLVDKDRCGPRGHLVGYTVTLFVNLESIKVYHDNNFIQSFERH